MVDIDRGPDPHDLLAALIADGYWRAERLDALTDATQGIDAATTANYLVDLEDRAAELMALGWAVKKAKGRGEVEVLIANLEADAHRTQHEESP